MQMLTGGQIRREYEIIQEALNTISLNEKFVADTDPGVIISETLEQLERSLSSIRTWYNKKAADRNAIAVPVKKELQKIISIASKGIGELDNSEPEDTNRTIG